VRWVELATGCQAPGLNGKNQFITGLFLHQRIENNPNTFIIKGAYPESPSYHKKLPVGAASSREIK